jgi:hypothetical protein
MPRPAVNQGRRDAVVERGLEDRITVRILPVPEEGRTP